MIETEKTMEQMQDLIVTIYNDLIAKKYDNDDIICGLRREIIDKMGWQELADD